MFVSFTLIVVAIVIGIASWMALVALWGDWGHDRGVPFLVGALIVGEGFGLAALFLKLGEALPDHWRSPRSTHNEDTDTSGP